MFTIKLSKSIINKLLGFGFVFLLVYIINSCVAAVDKNDVVASIGDYNLYANDVENFLVEKENDTDSLLLVGAFINRWARKKAVLEKARINLTDDESNFEELINDYKDGLLLNAYRQKIVSQYLDTLVTDNEISEFYKFYKSNFVLKTDIFKFKYACFPIGISNKNEIKALFKIEDKQLLLNKYCTTLSNSYDLKADKWIELKDFNNIEGFSNYNLPLLKGSVVEFNNSVNVYLVYIQHILRKGDLSPLKYASARVKNIILNKRKLKLLRKVEQQIFEDAVQTKELVIN